MILILSLRMRMRQENRPTSWRVALQKRTQGSWFTRCAVVAKEADSILGYIRKSVGSKSRVVILPMSSAHVKNCVQFWAPQYNRDVELLERKLSKIIKGLQHFSYEERLRDILQISEGRV